MPPTLSLVLNQIAASFTVLQHRSAKIVSLTMLTITVVAIATAPETDPGVWSWLGLLLTGTLASCAVLTFVASQSGFVSSENRQYRRTAAVTLGVLSLAINLLFSFGSMLVLAIGLIVLSRQAARIRPGSFPWMFCTILVVFVPWWIWSALDSWNAGLLALIPLAALAWLSGGHIREAYRTREEGETSPLSMRGHRLGAWMGMLLGGILVILVGLAGSSSNAWLALGGVLMIVAVAMEAGISRPANEPGKHAAAICDGAFLAVAICWMISIT